MRWGDMPDWSLRAALLAGMTAGPLVILWLTGQVPPVDIPVSTVAVVVSGLIVGIGVSYGGGCTSGHGVCGNARFSRRSMMATVTFMAASFVTVYVIRHVMGG
jgi:uncharacterized membrane protein YedE/YeeE